MKKLNSFVFRFISAAFLLLVIYSSNQLFSQQKQDSLITGVKYKIILYDDKEIIGKVISQDSVSVSISGKGGVYKVKKNDIFFISRELTPSVIKAMVSLGGGVIFRSGYDSYYGDFNTGFSLQLTALMPFSETKAIRLDLGYGQMKRDARVYEYSGSNYYSYSSYSAQTKNLYFLNADFIFGNFSPSTDFSVYGLAGLGILFDRESDYEEKQINYSQYDSTNRTWTYPGNNSTTFSLALGGGLRFKVGDRLGVYGEVQYNIVTFQSYYFFWNNGYFPLRAGLTYMFY